MQDDRLESFQTKTEVTCSANYCYYNKNNKCSAAKILVGTDVARFRSETECDTFKLK